MPVSVRMLANAYIKKVNHLENVCQLQTSRFPTLDVWQFHPVDVYNNFLEVQSTLVIRTLVIRTSYETLAIRTSAIGVSNPAPVYQRRED